MLTEHDKSKLTKLKTFLLNEKYSRVLKGVIISSLLNTRRVVMDIQEKIDLLGKVSDFFKGNNLKLKLIKNVHKSDELKLLYGDDENVGKVKFDIYSEVDYYSFRATQVYLEGIVTENKKKDLTELRKLIDTYPEEGRMMISKNT